MTRYPSATWKPISGTSTRPVTKDILCLHTMVGYLGSTWRYFNRPDVGVYSHIGVGGIWGSDAAAGLDGVAWQMSDTDYRAAANLDGNHRIISVETADNADRPIQPWTPKQQDTLVKILVDAHRLDGIPLVLIPDSKPGRRGIAYHRLGCDPYRVAGGELWSSSPGKDCPTQARIEQIPALIKRAQDIVNGTPEADLTPEEHDTLMGLGLDVERRTRGVIGQLLGGTMQRIVDLKATVEKMNTVQGDDEAKILAELDKVRDEVLKAVTPAPGPMTGSADSAKGSEVS